MWYEKAAEQGLAEAQFECGWMYSEGEGAPEDLEKARMWYEKSWNRTMSAHPDTAIPGATVAYTGCRIILGS